MKKADIAHFHFDVKRILAKPSQNAAIDAHAYIGRLRECDLADRSPVIDAESYIARRKQLAETREEEVAYVGLVLPPGVTMTALDVWRAMDRAARGKNGEYRMHGGRMPGLGLFMVGSITRGTGEADSIMAGQQFAQWLVDSFDVGVEFALHRKAGVVDHAHFLVTDRSLGPDGPGKKIRQFNGIADLKAGQGLEVEGGRHVAPCMERMRAKWAELLRDASGNPDVDHRSFARRGIDHNPCPNIPRGLYQYEQRHGIRKSLDQRDEMLAARRASQSTNPLSDITAEADVAKTAGSASMPQGVAEGDKPVATSIVPQSPKGSPQGVDIRATVTRAQMVQVSTAALERLQRELQACVDPELYAELLRRLRSEQETVAIRTALEARRLEEERARAAIVQRDNWARAFGAALVEGMLQRRTLRNGFEVRANSTSIERAPAEISSPLAPTVRRQQNSPQSEVNVTAPRNPIAEGIASPSAPRFNPPAAVSPSPSSNAREPANRLTAPVRAETVGFEPSVRASLPRPPAATSDSIISGPTEDSGQAPPTVTSRARAADVRDHVAVKTPSPAAGTESSAGNVSPGDFADVVSYAGALFKVGCLTIEARDALASLLGISAARLQKFAQANAPAHSPLKLIQTIIDGAVKRNDAWMVAIFQSFQPTPVQRRPAQGRSRGFDMTD